MIEDLRVAQVAAFPHKVGCHRFLRCLAGTKLARLGLRRDRDFQRLGIQKSLDSSGLSIPWHVEFGDHPTLMDTYLFKRQQDALAFQLWIPQIDSEVWKKAAAAGQKQIGSAMMKFLAKAIIGVQPMTGPASMVHTLKLRYGTP